VVDRCYEEAKIVAVEQEAKKSADAKAKAADKAALLALGVAAPAEEPVLEPASASASAEEPAATVEETPASPIDEKVPSVLEATEGQSAELMAHGSPSSADLAELPTEEQAISGFEAASQGSNHAAAEESETAALAEGIARPPGAERGG
jgi:hypothetical protein